MGGFKTKNVQPNANSNFILFSLILLFLRGAKKTKLISSYLNCCCPTNAQTKTF